MKVVAAFDSFKGSLTSMQACRTAEKAVKAVFPDAQVVCVPIADGGEGTAEAYYAALGGRMARATVTSPDFGKVEAAYAILPDQTAVIEMAQASGLTLIKEKNAGEATTFGTGELILDAIEKGCRRFIIGLGGSATNDGGVGALAALGVRFLNKAGEPIKPNGNGLAELFKIETDSMHPALKECAFTIACDVENPLCGREGATYVYGGQKGVTGADFERLDGNLRRFAECIRACTGSDVLNLKGGGAAGGMCAGLAGFLNVKIESGIKLLLKTIQFDRIIQNADYIISGEGKADKQTANGKVICGIGETAGQYGIPLILIAGQLEDGYEAVFEKGVSAAFSAVHYAAPFDPSRAERDLYDTVRNIFTLIKTVKER
ncbi:MAG TPA: glycerate kinase [Bacillota bacterium]|nr:glycerate kinase [Bacillota bacterium]HOK68070.1 glycerate kinase [Bacillota bacterium]